MLDMQLTLLFSTISCSYKLAQLGELEIWFHLLFYSFKWSLLFMHFLKVYCAILSGYSFG
jgi:hypothetical protein